MKHGESKLHSFFAIKFYYIMNKTSKTEIVDGTRYYHLMTRHMVNTILPVKEYTIFSKGIFSCVDFKTKWLEYKSVERSAGTNSWSFFDLLLYSLDRIIAFPTTPLAIASILVVFLCFLAFILICAIVLQLLVLGNHVESHPSLKGKLIDIKSKIYYSGYELKKDFNLLLDFLKTNKLTIILTWFFILFAYGIKLFFYSISIDTEAIINNYDNLLNSWLSIGRFGLIITKKILHLVPFNPYAANFLMLCSMFLFSIFLSFLFDYLTFQKSAKSKLTFILPCLFITAPWFAEQFNFTLQGFEVAFSIFLTLITSFLITKWIIDSKNIIHLILGIILMVWTFASYQAIVFLYISVSLACYFFLYFINSREKLNLNTTFFRVAPIKYLLTFVCGYAIYYVFNKLIAIKLGADKYLDYMISWGKGNNLGCIREILDYILHSKSYLIVSLVILFYSAINLFSKNKNKILFLLSSIALVLSPFFLAFYLGHALPPRSQFSLQFVYAFCIYILAWLLKDKKIIKYFALALIIALSFTRAYRVSNLMYTDYMKYQSEVTLANKISERIDMLNLDDKFKYPVVFVGKLHPLSTPNESREDVIGFSFFEWDYNTPHGSNYRILGFMKTIGYEFRAPTVDEIEKGKNLAEDMNCWPNANSVQFREDIILVKLS